MPPSDPAASARRLYEGEVAKHVLALREALVRHDENLKAWTLMNEVVPYYLTRHPEIERAREDQRLMVEHLLDPTVYERYYAANPYERPFEEQFGGQLTVETADRIPRVRWLCDKLGDGHDGNHLDLGCNDGWMGAHLLHKDLVSSVVGIDLAPDCVERARARGVNAVVSKVEDAPNVLGLNAECGDTGLPLAAPYDSASCFEVLEHVLDPAAVILAAAECLKGSGRLFLSTPLGATEQGDLPNWDYVEHKGHVRAWTPDDFVNAVEDCDLKVEELVIDPDGLMLLEARHA